MSQNVLHSGKDSSAQHHVGPVLRVLHPSVSDETDKPKPTFPYLTASQLIDNIDYWQNQTTFSQFRDTNRTLPLRCGQINPFLRVLLSNARWISENGNTTAVCLRFSS